MKPIVIFLFLAALTWTANAQSEMRADSITPAPPAEGTALPEGVRSYDGFLLDMDGLMKTAAPTLPHFTLEIPDASKDISFLMRPQTDAIYTQGLSDMFSGHGMGYYGPWGLYGLGDPLDNLQMGSFRLKNGWRLNTYGEYNQEGYKVYNPSALPWERNNFKGAFEFKSQDGSFGIRVEVQRGRKTPF